MDSHALTHTDTTAAEVTAPRGGRSRLLLLGGAVAGPLFTVVVAAQALTRVGFDLAHQPLSLLSLGELGWVQVTNFVLAGTLMVCLALGMRRVLTAGPGRIWAPRLMATFGVGLVLGGVFVPDPALGYPPGTPDAIPADFSWHGALHAVAPPLAFTALVACCLVLARRFVTEQRRAWAAYSAATAAAALTLSAWPGLDGASVRLAVAIFLAFLWTTLLALDVRRGA